MDKYFLIHFLISHDYAKKGEQSVLYEGNFQPKKHFWVMFLSLSSLAAKIVNKRWGNSALGLSECSRPGQHKATSASSLVFPLPRSGVQHLQIFFSLPVVRDLVLLGHVNLKNYASFLKSKSMFSGSGKCRRHLLWFSGYPLVSWEEKKKF